MAHGVGDDDITILEDSTFFNMSGVSLELQVWLTMSEGEPNPVIGSFASVLAPQNPQAPRIDTSTWFHLGQCVRSVGAGVTAESTTIYVVSQGTPVNSDPPTNPLAQIDWSPTPASEGQAFLMIAYDNGLLYYFLSHDDLPAQPGAACSIAVANNTPLTLSPAG